MSAEAPGVIVSRKVEDRSVVAGVSTLRTPVSATGQAPRSSRHKALILMYHRVADSGVDPWSLCVAPDRFAQQLEVLKKHARPIRLQELGQALACGEVPDRAVAITFDDGYADNLHNAKPLLSRHAIPATVFVTTGYLDGQREFWWDEIERVLLAPGSLPPSLNMTIDGTDHRWDLGKPAHYSEAHWQRDLNWKASDDPPTSRHAVYIALWRLLQPLADTKRLKALDTLRGWARVTPALRPAHRALSIQELRAFAQDELIEIGAHSVTHPVLAGLPVVLQRHEILRSQGTLGEILGRSIESFAYPYGAYSLDTVTLIREAGFACACSTVARVVERDADPLQLPRVAAQNWDGDEFGRRLQEWLA
jgi:peptidoglycan/xylan/chitin deacetylase (PgdA/CDA1 family)